MEKAQAMRLDACLPQSWWEFSVLHAVHLYNRTLVRRIDWKTPYEKLKHKVPDVSHLRVFGCGAYVFIPEEVCINKLAPRSELMTFIGLMRLCIQTVLTQTIKALPQLGMIPTQMITFLQKMMNLTILMVMMTVV